MAARGKIARLPHEIREQLNRRMRNGEKGRGLVEWLNSLLEVKGVLAAEFGGQPILEQNLSQYRRRGYRDWVNKQEAFEEVQRQVKESAEFEQAVPGGLSDRFANFVVLRYASAMSQLRQKGADTEKDWRRLREFCQDVAALRRGDHRAETLRLEQERLEWQRAGKGTGLDGLDQLLNQLNEGNGLSGGEEGRKDFKFEISDFKGAGRSGPEIRPDPTKSDQIRP
jgi:hypothetical protein